MGASDLGGVPGVAWMRSGGWLQLGPGRGRRDGGARVPHLEVVRHGPPPPTSTGLTTNGGGLGVGCPEEAGLRRGPYARWDGDGGGCRIRGGVVRHGPPGTAARLTANGDGLGVGCPEEAGLKPARTKDVAHSERGLGWRAFGQGGLPGVAGVRPGCWVLLGPGRGRRDGGGGRRAGRGLAPTKVCFGSPWWLCRGIWCGGP